MQEMLNELTYLRDMFKIFSLFMAALLGWIFSRGSAAAGLKNESTIVANQDINLGTPYEDLFRSIGKKYNLPWQILSAIAFVESSYSPNAINYSDNESIGLMQILCRPDGSGGCANKFPVVQDWDRIKKQDLFDPVKNIEIGAQILRWNIDQFGLEKGIAVYNSWDQRLRKPPFKNQSYVNKVLNKAKELGYEEN